MEKAHGLMLTLRHGQEISDTRRKKERKIKEKVYKRKKMKKR